MDIYLDYEFNIMQEENKMFSKGNNHFDYIDLYVPLEAVKDHNILPTFNFEGPTMKKYGPYCHTSSRMNNDYIVFQIKLSNSILSEKGKLFISVIINFNDEDSGEVIKTKYVTTQAIILDSIVVDGDSYIIIGDEKRVLDSISQKIEATTNLAKNNYIYLEEFKENYNVFRKQMIFLYNKKTDGQRITDIDIKDFKFSKDDILPQEFFVLSKDAYIHLAKLQSIDEGDNGVSYFYTLEQSNKNVNFENANILLNLETRNLSVANKIKSKLVPYNDLTYDLGSDVKAWKKIYIGQNGLSMRTFYKDENGNHRNFRPISLSNNKDYPTLNINVPANDGLENKMAAFSKGQEEIRFYLTNQNEESFTFKNFDGTNFFHINDGKGSSKIQFSSKHKIDFANENAKIAVTDELSIIPNIDTDSFSNTSEYNRIKFGGYELLTNDDIEDDNTTELIMCYKPANSIGEVVPFAITKSGKVYYKGYEVASKQYTENIINNSLIQEAQDRDEAINNAITKLVNGSPEALDTLLELSEALGNDPNFATTITNALANKVDKESDKRLIPATEDSQADFNDYHSAGFYRLTTGLKNSPRTNISNASSSYYNLLVISGKYNNEPTQIASYSADNMIFVRKYSTGGGWSSWFRIDGQDKANLTDFNNLKSDYEAFKSGVSTGEDLTSANLLINKNIYNLGAYDTIVNNGDGTATITRQTGYVTLDGNQKVYNWVIDDNYNTLELENMITDYIHFNVYNDNLTMTTIQSNIPHIAANKTPSVVSLVYAYTLRIVYPSSLSIATSEQANDWLSQNPVYIQYQLKTSYTEKVILKQPLLDLPQDGTEWLREEWEKGLNLCIKYEVGHYSLGVYSYLEPNTTYTIKGTSSNSTLTLPNLSINGITYWSDDYSKFLNNGFSFTTKSNLEKGKHLISFDVNVADTSDISNIMLNKGSHALPYKPYSGKLIRQSEFDTLQDKVSSLENQINTTIASLTSQVQELTDRLTASITRTINKDSINYAYDGTNYSASGGFSVDGQVKSVSVNPATVVVSFNDSVISWSYSSTLKLMKDIVISYTYIANSVQALNELQTLELVDGEYVVEDEIEENVDDEKVVEDGIEKI